MEREGERQANIKEKTIYTVEASDTTWDIESDGIGVTIRVDGDDGYEFNVTKQDARDIGQALNNAANKT